jgi:FixJ family two-component response regulator
MPEMDGLQVQKQLAGQGETIPIVFLTGHGDIPASVRALKSGAEDFLTKPVDADELIAAVRGALRRDKTQQVEKSELLEIQCRLDGLTNRQRAVFEYVISGKMNKQIAAELGTGEQNIKVHRRRVMRKMGARSLADLVRMAERLGVQPTI